MIISIIALTVTILIVIYIITTQKNIDKIGYLIAVALGHLIYVPIVVVLIRTTTGLYDDFSSGYRIGYITKISHVGVIWKTYEGEIQLGTGNTASLQKPFKFSVKNNKIIEKINVLIETNVRVKLKYKQWLMQPYRYGSTSYEIINIVEILQ
tara:strand:+ start:2296 stop:2751 length:456 start_codon:yes stop_codon:yes gene_type:complete